MAADLLEQICFDSNFVDNKKDDVNKVGRPEARMTAGIRIVKHEVGRPGIQVLTGTMHRAGACARSCSAVNRPLNPANGQIHSDKITLPTGAAERYPRARRPGSRRDAASGN
jgi:hypothetical protein